jgi:hypothetical protein
MKIRLINEIPACFYPGKKSRPFPLISGTINYLSWTS